MEQLPDEIYNIILSYLCNFIEIIHFKYLNQKFNQKFNNYYDAIIFLPFTSNLLNSFNLPYYEYLSYEYKTYSQYINNIIIINDIRQLKHLNLQKIQYLNLSYLDREQLYGLDYVCVEYILFNCPKVKYLNINNLKLSIIPKTLIELEYLDISDNFIKFLPKEFKNLTHLISNSYITDGLRYIPSNILRNLIYIYIPFDHIKHDIYLSKEKIKTIIMNVSPKINNINKKNKIYIIDKYNQIIEITPTGFSES